MKLLLSVLGLTIIATAEKAESSLKKRGIQQRINGYPHDNSWIPITNPRINFRNGFNLIQPSYGYKFELPISYRVPRLNYGFYNLPLNPELDYPSWFLGHIPILQNYDPGLFDLNFPSPAPLKYQTSVSVPTPILPAPAVARQPTSETNPTHFAPTSMPSSAAATPYQFQPGVGRLGSGSLGYTRFANGVIALGSGSLGFSPLASPSPPSSSITTPNVQQGDRYQEQTGTARYGNFPKIDLNNINSGQFNNNQQLGYLQNAGASG